MGFDNECILSIQSLPGEYFCPVCRLLVYPNEAFQSLCTHLYCKPCLNYVTSTSRACPYDGYLVTEADSKPLIETNKVLAETIGKIRVHCLYHRSGCSWLGSLSECVCHCSGCAYGNYPVVCNRCAVQIMHCQVLEHTQSCPGVLAQAQADVGAATVDSADQTQGATQNVMTVSSSQLQAVAQPAVHNAEQWYQQPQLQNQYQQYYQQHPGYDQYQQYYPNQQQSVPVASNLQAPVAIQPQNQAQQVHPGVAPQTYPLQPQQQPRTQYPRPQAQPQIQTQVQPYPQTNKDPNAVIGHPSYSQSHIPSQPQVEPGSQLQNPIQQPTQMGPQHSYAIDPSQQQQVLLFPPPGQVQNTPPAQQLGKQPYAHQSGQAVRQQPVMQPVQQAFPQKLPTAPAHLRLQEQSHVYPQMPQSVVAFPPNPVGTPPVAGHGVQSQPYSQYGVGAYRPPVYPGPYQQSSNKIHKSSNQMPMASGQQFSMNAKPTMSASVANAHAQIESERSSVDVKPVSSETKVTDEGRADQTGKNSTETNHSVEMQGGLKEESIIMKEENSEGALSHFSNGESVVTVTNDIKDVLNHAALFREDKKTVDGSDKVLQGASIASTQLNGGFMEPPRPVVDQVIHQPLSSHSTIPQRPITPPLGLPPPQSHFGPQGPGAFGPPSSRVFPPRATPPGPGMKGVNGFDSSSPVLSRDERLRFQDERPNPSFPAGLDRHMPDRAEYLEDMKRFPRPFERGPRELQMESVALPSRFFSPCEGHRGRVEDPFGRMEPSRGHPDFFGAGPSFGREHRDILLRGYRGLGPEDIHGREGHRFGEPFGGPFPESRFSMLPSHLRRSEFDGHGSMGMGDRIRNDFLGHNRFSSHLHDFHLREPLGFEALSHARTREIGGSEIDLFGRGDRPNHPQLGEPGFRSSFAHRGLPIDGGIITGELSFDISKKRKPPSVGWCRICKVDCETVEGLDLHSQTSEHQKMTMDIVTSIKQKAKRKKLTSDEQPLPRDESKPGNSGGEEYGNEN